MMQKVSGNSTADRSGSSKHEEILKLSELSWSEDFQITEHFNSSSITRLHQPLQHTSLCPQSLIQIQKNYQRNERASDLFLNLSLIRLVSIQVYEQVLQMNP